MDGKDEEGDLDFHNNVSQCGSDTNDNGSVTAKDKEPTGTRSEAQKRRHHSSESEETQSWTTEMKEATFNLISPHLRRTSKGIVKKVYDQMRALFPIVW
ncbi:hypothetical protein O181_050101 [Austropuccinia psidii MF-1]|uniref:Uncharacterized protein n=1 Tax=Austropuccinia psidii MF-1 TaxID=1389203 RepID=A0A9Q3HM16_9BASI|nr:hypothetical protein [Austropuccinia psidii MF-1]